jgi:hypothetical protein
MSENCSIFAPDFKMIQAKASRLEGKLNGEEDD